MSNQQHQGTEGIFIRNRMISKLTVKVAVAAASHEIIKHVEWKQRIFELTEVQLQNAGDGVDVFSIQLVQQWIFP